MLFTRDGHNVFLGDLFRGHSAFLICGGPSLKSHDLSLLNARGILTLAVNNAATVVRPQLWTSVDDPGHFCDAIWADPGILKFVPFDHMEKHFLVRDDADHLVLSQAKVGDMPGVFGFRRNEHFRADQWLHESTFNWGNHTDRVDEYGHKGSRSVFYVALRLLYFLGVRTVYLLGCDFRMEEGRPNYAFEQDRSPASVRSNNSSYRILNVRLGHLKPHFDAEGFRVFNCTPGSGLTVFPALDFGEAVRRARSAVPGRINTSGMYDFKANQRKAKPPKQAAAGPPRPANPAPPEPIPHKPAPTPAVRATGSEFPVTLLVYADTGDLDALRESWQTWDSHLGWFRNAPAVVCRHRSVAAADSRWDWLRGRPATRYECGADDASAPGAFPRWSLLAAAKSADRPWVLCLSPAVEARAGAPGLDPAWFEPRAGSSRAYVAPRRGGRLSPETAKQLHEWARTSPALAPNREPSADVPFVGAPLFLVRTDWLRGVAPLLASAPAGVPADAVLGYVAARRYDQGLRVNFRQFGWEERKAHQAANGAAKGVS
jgi:hypothetical protein